MYKAILITVFIYNYSDLKVLYCFITRMDLYYNPVPSANISSCANDM